MKRCPSCYRTYADETLTFCLADGSLLSAPYDTQAEARRSDSTPTEVMPRRSSPDSAPHAFSTPSFGHTPTTPHAPFPAEREKEATGYHKALFTSPLNVAPTAQSEFLIEPAARMQTAALYILMRVLVALIGSLTAYAIYSAAFQHFQLPTDVYWALRIVQRIFAGMLLVTGQVLLLRKYLKPMWAWVLLTILTVIVVSFIDYVLTSYVGEIVFNSNSEFLKTTGWSILMEINSALLWFCVGVAQWFVLLRRVRAAWLWIAAAIIAEIIFYVTIKVTASFGIPPNSITGFALTGLTAGSIIGVIQALILLRFRKKKANR